MEVHAETHQKSLELIMDVVFKFRDTSEMALNTGTGILRTLKACLQPPDYCRFVYNEKNFLSFQDSLLSLVEVNVKLGMSSRLRTVERAE